MTVFFHSGYKKYRTDQLGPGLKGGSPDINGDLTVVDCRALQGDGHQHCRLLSLNCSDEFLAWLATKTKNQKYNAYHSQVYINGRKRIDSETSYNAPKLTHETSSKLLKSNNNMVIMLHSATRLGYGKEMEKLNQLSQNKINEVTRKYLSLTLSLSKMLFSGHRKNLTCEDKVSRMYEDD